MIKIVSSKFHGSNRVTYKPFSFIKIEWLRKIIAAIMGEKDYDKILYVKFIIVMEGGYNRIRLDDLIIDDKGYKWKVLWKTGSHALIESQGNIEPENYDKIININGRRIAILSEKYLIK